MKRRWKIGYIFEVKVWKIGSDQETFHSEFLVPSLPRREHDPEESPPPYYRCTRAWRVSWPREESTSRVIGIPRAPLWVALILDVIHGILVSDRPGIPIFSHAGRIPDQRAASPRPLRVHENFVERAPEFSETRPFDPPLYEREIYRSTCLWPVRAPLAEMCASWKSTALLSQRIEREKERNNS